MNLIWVCPPPGDGNVVLAQSSVGHVTLATIRKTEGGWEFQFERGARNPGPYSARTREWAQRQIKGFLTPRLDRLVRDDERPRYGGYPAYEKPSIGVDAMGRPFVTPPVPKRPTRRRYR